MNRPTTLFELIENSHFRSRPSMYLRGSRALDMVKFIDAYQICEMHNKLDSGILDFFFQFNLFLYEKLEEKLPSEKSGNYHWYQILEIIASMENKDELNLFIIYYDEFKEKLAD